MPNKVTKKISNFAAMKGKITDYEVMAPVGIGKGMFGGRLLRNGILFGGEHLAQRGIVALDVLVCIVDFHTFDIVYYVALSVAVAGRKEQDAP